MATLRRTAALLCAAAASLPDSLAGAASSVVGLRIGSRESHIGEVRLRIDPDVVRAGRRDTAGSPFIPSSGGKSPQIIWSRQDRLSLDLSFVDRTQLQEHWSSRDSDFREIVPQPRRFDIATCVLKNGEAVFHNCWSLQGEYRALLAARWLT